MATLADSFLQDLADLEDDLEDDLLGTESNDKDPNNNFIQQEKLNDIMYNIDGDDDQDIPDAIMLFEKSQIETTSIVSNLSLQPSFIELLRQVKKYIFSTSDKQGDETFDTDINNVQEDFQIKLECNDNDNLKVDSSIETNKNKFMSVIENKIENSTIKNEEPENKINIPLVESNSTPDYSESYLIEQSNELIAKLDIEILNIHSFIRDIYSKKFPELESIVTSPLEYIAVVQRIKNETDLTTIELVDILPNTVTMAVTVAGSMTTGFPLPPSDLDKVLKACEEAIHLADCRKLILKYLESRMDVIAPNVSAIIGSALAARLVTHANGIVRLAQMPSQNIMLIGSSSTSVKSTGHNTHFISTSTGSSSTGISGTTTSLGATSYYGANAQANSGGIIGGSTVSSGSASRSIIYGCDIIQMTPINLRNRALKLVSGKLGLAARVDSFHESPNGDMGRALREYIVRTLIKAQEPPPAPLKKSLPVPDDIPKTRRGGKRYRHAKEKYSASEYKKEANHLTFGPEAEEELDLEGEVTLGMINKGYRRLRLQTKQLKIQVKRQKKQQRLSNIDSRTVSSKTSHRRAQSVSSGATGGMSSSLAFTPLQGIELCNPNAFRPQLQTIKESNEYFSTAVTFVKSEEAV